MLDEARSLGSVVDRLSEQTTAFTGVTEPVTEVVREAKSVGVPNVTVRVSDWYWKALLIACSGWVVAILLVVYLAHHKA
ncbi:hypothetical protein [Actinomadura napierensis]|uniref:hypothetical protein n=1 Tax=Actinomadura napierensis TaxID=267854 RepID=UPI0031DC505F